MRAKLVEFAGNLGDKLRAIDDAYAGAIRSAIMPNSPTGNPLSVARSVTGAVVGAPLGHGLAELGPDPRVVDQLLKYAIPATSATVRYGLPAAGLTVAGNELINLIQQLDNEKSV